MKNINVYDFNEIKEILLKHMSSDMESYIQPALFEWSCYDRFIHINVDKLESISVEYEEDGRKFSVDGKVPGRVQKWIEIVNKLIPIIESGELPEEFIIDYESNLSLYK